MDLRRRQHYINPAFKLTVNNIFHRLPDAERLAQTSEHLCVTDTYISDTANRKLQESCMDHSKYKATIDASHENKNHEIRFKTLLFLWRLGGIPLHMKSVSTVNTVYNVTVIVCFYVTNFCLCVDTFVHRHQLAYAMKKLHLLLGMQVSMWTHFRVRYAEIESSFILYYYKVFLRRMIIF
jgi:hypothetical protein